MNEPWKEVGMTVRSFAAFCGGPRVLPHSTLWKAMNGQTSTVIAEKVKPLVREGLRKRLLAMGFDASEAETRADNLLQASAGETVEAATENIMPEKRSTLTPAQARHFGFRFDPFVLPPQNREESWTSPDLDALFSRVKNAASRQGFIAVTGVPGGGKTELRKRLIHEAKKSNGNLMLVWPEYADMRRVTVGVIYASILRTFGQDVPRDLDLRERRLHALLEAKSNDGVSVALCYEDAHELDDRVLRVQKRFHELGDGGYERWLGVVMFGQPALAARLDDYRFSEVAQRVEVSPMPDLNPATAWSYVEHRCSIAGVAASDVFEKNVVERLVGTHKTPLALGNACARLLIETWQIGERKVVNVTKTDASSSRIIAARKAS